MKNIARRAVVLARRWRRRFRWPAVNALPLAGTDAERRVLSVIEKAQKAGDLHLNVPVADGRMLRLLTAAAGARRVVEIGASTGFSGLWICLALQETGGSLTTFELDPGRAATARRHFAEAGVDKIVTVVEGDAHRNAARVTGPLDMVFIDAEKSGYVDYLKAVLPLVRPGGLILAHNIDLVPEYVKLVTSDPALETLFYLDGNQLGISLKKY